MKGTYRQVSNLNLPTVAKIASKSVLSGVCYNGKKIKYKTGHDYKSTLFYDLSKKGCKRLILEIILAIFFSFLIGLTGNDGSFFFWLMMVILGIAFYCLLFLIETDYASETYRTLFINCPCIIILSFMFFLNNADSNGLKNLTTYEQTHKEYIITKKCVKNIPRYIWDF